MRQIDGAGYLFVDNRLSGGLLEEDDLLGCAHCPAPIRKSSWFSLGGWKCYSCDKPLCEPCRKKPPQLKCSGSEALQLERKLSDLHRREQNAKLLGI